MPPSPEVAPRESKANPEAGPATRARGPEAPSTSEVPSLAFATLRRAFVTGRLYVVISVAFSFIFATVVLSIPRGGATALAASFPLQAPVYLVFASTGALMVFTSDRSKGVLEYLIAYGHRPSALFWDGAFAAAGLVALALAASLPLALGLAWARGAVFTSSTLTLVALYTVPMTFAGAVFTTMVGMLWSAISSPRAGMNSPVGLAPVVGIGPQLIVLVLASATRPGDVPYIGAAASAVLIGAVALLTALSNRLIVRERFLSPL